MLTAILPTGRVVWLQSRPALASAGAVRDVAVAGERTARRRQLAALHQSAAIRRLARIVAGDARRLSEANAQRHAAARRRLVKEFDTLDQRISKAAAVYRRRVAEQMRIDDESMRRLIRRAFWDQIVLVTAAALFAAYGERGKPFGSTNLALTLALLIWLAGDEVADALIGSKNRSPYPLRDADIWSYIAPFGNILAAWWLFGDRQHERFVAGRVAVGREAFVAQRRDPGRFEYRLDHQIDLEKQIAPAHYPTFRGYANVAAVATIGSATPSAVATDVEISPVRTAVRNGRLHLMLTVTAQDTGAPTDPIPPALDAIDIAWMVDTAAPGAAVKEAS